MNIFNLAIVAFLLVPATTWLVSNIRSKWAWGVVVSLLSIFAWGIISTQQPYKVAETYDLVPTVVTSHDKTQVKVVFIDGKVVNLNDYFRDVKLPKDYDVRVTRYKERYYLGISYVGMMHKKYDLRVVPIRPDDGHYVLKSVRTLKGER